MIKTSRFLALPLVALLACVTMTGCNQKTIAALTQILGTQAANVAKLENDPALATKLAADTTAAVTAITNWKSGTPAQDVVQALDLVEADLNLFPVANQYAPLVDLAIGTVDSILALLPPPPATTAVLRRHVALFQPAPKNSKQFIEQWNALVKANPRLAPAQIRSKLF